MHRCTAVPPHCCTAVPPYCRQVVCWDQAGCEHKHLVKSGNDDLRQDAVMQQFFGLVNALLAGDRWGSCITPSPAPAAENPPNRSDSTVIVWLGLISYY